MEIQDVFVAHPQTEAETSALKAIMNALKIKFEVAKESPYHPDFVAKILESRQQIREGQTVTMALNDIWEA